MRWGRGGLGVQAEGEGESGEEEVRAGSHREIRHGGGRLCGGTMRRDLMGWEGV
jgi:hypothetical protein